MPKKKRGVHKTIKIRIRTEVLTKKKKKRLKQITARDTRIIKEYLRIIKHRQDTLLIQRKGTWKVKKGDLDLVTLTTKKRKKVPHDFKKRFTRCSQNEFQECRDTACWIIESWKALEETEGKEQGFPTITGQVPRTQSPHGNRFRIETVRDNTLARWWIGIGEVLHL